MTPRKPQRITETMNLSQASPTFSLLRVILLSTSMLPIGVGTLIGQSSVPRVGERQPPADWLSECPGGPSGAWCGSYEVWEDREAREGRRIGLNVVVMPAASGTPASDALVWLDGGPGGAATESGPGIGGALASARVDRDLLLVDQRGTGSSNPLDCAAPAPGGPLQEHFDEFFPLDYVRACLDAQNADVTQYTTPIAMDDLNEVRAALGYDKLTLFGGSYGTRAGLIYMRRHPETVRAVVLKGVAPTNMRNPLPFARALDAGISGVFQACAAEPDCAAHYPDLERDWARLAERFEQGPVTAMVTHEGRTEEVTISKGVFADGVRHILYQVRQSTTLPRIITKAAAGDFDEFAQRELTQSIGFGDALSMGMFMTVTCSEDLQFLTEEEIRRETEGTFMGDYRIRRQLAACAIWGRGEVDETYFAPVTADTPTLLLSGEFDTATPVSGADWVAEYLPNALHIVVPNESHGFANPACEFGIVNQFLVTGTFEGLETSCVLETVRPPFERAGS
jgi:pimeloyl-ACP methyl ester carboxylesterase